jgi:hypothetical protein
MASAFSSNRFAALDGECDPRFSVPRESIGNEDSFDPIS